VTYLQNLLQVLTHTFYQGYKMNSSLLELNLGIDFGTQFTKVCVRDTSRQRSWIITFTNGCSSLNEALIPTKIGICEDGALLAGLTESEWQKQNLCNVSIIDYIKMRLANLDLMEEGNQYPSDLLPQIHGIDLNQHENLENLCAYYLRCVIVKAKQWVLENNTDLVKNQEIYWTANVGVPVKYCDSDVLKRFKRVLCIAWLLSKSQPQDFHQLQKKIIQLRQNIDDKKIPCFAIPEIAAGIYSYTISREAEADKIYTFFDIGSGTIEGASFLFWRENEMPKIDFYSGEVEPLGVKALAKYINSKVSGLRLQVEQDIIHNSKLLLEINNLSTRLSSYGLVAGGEFIVNKFKVTDKVIEKQLLNNISPQDEKLLHLILGQGFIHRQVAKVVMTSIEKNRQYFQNSSKEAFNLVIFLGGGGRESDYYYDTIKTTYTAFNHQHAGVPPYQVQELPFPKDDFDMSGIKQSYFHRFAVAYGLSIEEYNAPDIKLPSRSLILPPQAAQPFTPEIGRYPDDNSSM
jgi:hypothetical protein